MRVRRLRGEIHREAARAAVHVREDAAWFQRCGMNALELDFFVDLNVRSRERDVRLRAVADFPMINVVGLIFSIVANDERVAHRLERIGDHLERLVIDLDEFGGIERHLA